jgi:hypothetical protein
MARRIAFSLIALLVLAGSALAAEGERHSGRIVEVRPDGKLVLEEMGPWKGPGTGLVRHTFDLAPNTAVGEVRAKAAWDPNDVMPGHDVRPLDLTQIKPGDFVTVVTNGNRRSGAIALDVVRPEATEGGLASPKAVSQPH